MMRWLDHDKSPLYVGITLVLIALCGLAALLWGPQ
jgi:hypothetical protein